MDTLKTSFDNFILRKRLAGLTDKTIVDYTSFVGMFINYIGGDSLVCDLTENRVYEYIATLYTRKLSQSTVSTYVRHVKVFLTWLESMYAIVVNAVDIKIPKSPKKHPRIYSDKEIEYIYKVLTKSDTWLSFRNCAIVSLMLDSGLRQNEVCTLNWDCIDFDSRILKVYGKGRKERIVPLGQISAYYLQEYKLHCPHYKPYVFVNRSGKPLTCNAVKLFMQKLSKHMPFEFSSHKLRHNFATNFLIDQYERNGSMDIYALMSIMGHENIETTKRYLHLANQIVYSKSHISHVDKILLAQK